MIEYEEMPWSPEGRVLAVVFESLIRNYGGRLKLAKDIEFEARSFGINKLVNIENERYKFYKNQEMEFIKQNFHKGIPYLQLTIDRSYHALRHKIRQLKFKQII